MPFDLSLQVLQHKLVLLDSEQLSFSLVGIHEGHGVHCGEQDQPFVVQCTYDMLSTVFIASFDRKRLTASF